MTKKNSSRRWRRHPELANQIFSSAGPSQINGYYQAVSEDLPELLGQDGRGHGKDVGERAEWSSGADMSSSPTSPSADANARTNSGRLTP